jgi:hypothetical protein
VQGPSPSQASLRLEHLLHFAMPFSTVVLPSPYGLQIRLSLTQFAYLAQRLVVGSGACLNTCGGRIVKECGRLRAGLPRNPPLPQTPPFGSFGYPLEHGTMYGFDRRHRRAANHNTYFSPTPLSTTDAEYLSLDPHIRYPAHPLRNISSSVKYALSCLKSLRTGP